MTIGTFQHRGDAEGDPYHALIADLGACFDHNGSDAEAGIAAVRDTLKAFGKDNLRAFLAEAIERPEWLDAVAGRSYLHGNGFYKIILEENAQFRLRLHVWLPTTRAEENIHDHRWHFASLVLNSRLETEIWEDALSDGGETLNEYLYVGKDIGARNVYMGKARVSLKARVFNGEGDAYHMMSNVLHRIIYDGQDAVITLLCHARGARNWARTITRRTAEPNIDHDFIDADKLKSVLDMALMRFEEQQAGDAGAGVVYAE
jgi:hypothetical protein